MVIWTTDELLFRNVRRCSNSARAAETTIQDGEVIMWHEEGDVGMGGRLHVRRYRSILRKIQTKVYE